jgi:hypothetical protein
VGAFLERFSNGSVFVRVLEPLPPTPNPYPPPHEDAAPYLPTQNGRYLPYPTHQLDEFQVGAFLERFVNGSVFVATDSPKFLAEVRSCLIFCLVFVLSFVFFFALRSCSW